MSKIWYCANCGYEMESRGKCHACGERLVASSLPALAAGDEDDEVGYRLDDWEDADRGHLIEELNRLEIAHRFEDDELVVALDDESRVDDLLAELTTRGGRRGGATTGSEAAVIGGAADYSLDGDPATVEAVRLLARACAQLRKDPTDMGADVDVAEASTGVFMADFFPGADEDTWAAVGRVTRRLLAALSAEDALEDEIRSQASVLARLIAPFVGDGGFQDQGQPEKAAEMDVADIGGAVPVGPFVGEEPVEELPKEAPLGGASGDEATAGSDGADDDSDEGETVYELTEWLPEERAQLDVMLEDANIAFEWDGDDLIVPSDRETDVEALFETIRGPGSGDDDGEGIYHAMEELFATVGGLASDPMDEIRQTETVARISDIFGPPPIGFDEVHWLRIMKESRALSQHIEEGSERHVIQEGASGLRDLLRSVV
jgi:hypothetical protein